MGTNRDVNRVDFVRKKAEQKLQKNLIDSPDSSLQANTDYFAFLKFMQVESS